MSDWEKVEDGWYVHARKGCSVQRWYKSYGSPLNKAGWYVWLKDYQPVKGPYKTKYEAIIEAMREEMK